jgi:hydrogenase maturation protease
VSATEGPLVAIGVGNVLLGDDGAGVRVIERLRGMVAGDTPLPPGTRLVDGGTLGLDLLGELDGARGVVFADAGDRGEAPGSLRIHRGADAIGAAVAGGAGGDGVAELVAVAKLLGVLPWAVSIVEIAAGEIAVGTGLSPRVEMAMPRAAEAVRRELVAMADGAPAIREERQAVPAGATA